MHAPYGRSPHCQFAIVLLSTFGLTIAVPILGQSARTSVVIPAALATFGPQPVAPRCVATLSTATAIESESGVRDDPAQPSVADDSADVRDDALDADALLPGSGMVVVDSHGKIIASDRPLTPPVEVSPAEVSPAECCPVAPGSETAVTARQAANSYTPSNGSDMRARCVDAMKPPPSSSSPL